MFNKSSKLQYKKKKEARLILQSGIYIYIFFTYISEGTAFLLQGLTYNDEVRLRCVLKTLKKEGRLCLPRYSNALYAFLLQGLACNDEVKLRYVRPWRGKAFRARFQNIDKKDI